VALFRVDEDAPEGHPEHTTLFIETPLSIETPPLPCVAQLLLAPGQINEVPRLRLAVKDLLGIRDPGVQLAPGQQVLRLLDDPPDVTVPGQLG